MLDDVAVDIDIVRRTARAALRGHPHVVLAVSGGLDSMVLLSAATSVAGRTRLVVATFDHGTGQAATDACALVTQRATELGLEWRAGRAKSPLSTEADLRAARWSFLRSVAANEDATVATAHTADDQLETVLMRVMRATGARGLAGLYAKSEILRPFVGVNRCTLEKYAIAESLSWFEDPSNSSRVYFRNRVRHDLLPALRGVRPHLGAELLDASSRAARLRTAVECFVDEVVQPSAAPGGVGVDIPAENLRMYDARGLAVLWPAIVARAGLVVDRRGLARLVDFTPTGRTGARMQLSGGWQVIRARERFEVRKLLGAETTMTELSLSNTTSHGAWLFRQVEADRDEGSWAAWLPIDRPLAVRAWRAGDVMTASADRAPAKVKRLLSDAGLTGHQRKVWPVVLSGDQIIWIPGVRRGSAASDRSGGSGLPFLCEYVNC